MTNLTGYPFNKTVPQPPERVAQAVRALERYSNGGTIKAALFYEQLEHRYFYKCLAEHIELQELYDETQRLKASSLVDDALELSEDNEKSAKEVKARADLKLRIAALYDRKKFGSNNDITLDATPNLLAALTNANNRLPLPEHDLKTITTHDYVDITNASTDTATDEKAVATPSFDPFGD